VYGLRLRRGPRFGNWRLLEEVATQGSFQIGYKLAHELRLGHAEGGSCGVPDSLKFRLSVVRLDNVLWCGCLRGSVLDGRLGFMRDRSRKKILAQGRLKIGNEPLQSARSRRANQRFGPSMLIV
jgi:hypothetical protein